MPTGWDEADRDSQVRRIADGIETIEFPKVSKTVVGKLIFMSVWVN